MEDYKYDPTQTMQELDEIQLRSNTKDARTGRNTNTSILVATDMHATETLNQQCLTLCFTLADVRHHVQFRHMSPFKGDMHLNCI